MSLAKPRHATINPNAERALCEGITTTTPHQKLVAGKWKIGRKLGSGGFGNVHIATCNCCGSIAAVKIAIGSKVRQLESEYVVYKTMESATRALVGIPEAFAFDYHTDRGMLVMSCLGPSLESLLDKCDRSMSVHTVYQIAVQLLLRIEFVHSCSYIHRDIKPDNLLIGRKPNEITLFLVDFGLAKFYRDRRTKQHIVWKEGKPLIGTIKFCSVNTHRGIEQSRRDDLESIGYVLVYLFRGRLPWQRVTGSDQRQKREKIRWMKERICAQDLCTGMGSAMVNYFNYVRAMPFESRPDYSYLRSLFRGGLERRGLKTDGVFDWMKVSSDSGASSGT